ncbi:MAG TPA: bifunctional nuclease domain-containing protein [Thermomicrobiales bacterium]|nr:bifunctional nuclease domain-containing protein [Thermomicrobiales bacterium]
MIETTVESIRVSLVTQHRVVILKELEGERHLPIWIGAYEAEAIAMELQGIAPTRPLPYDLMRSMLAELNATVDRVVITDLNDQVFFAQIHLDQHGHTIELDSRPSDAIALAVRVGCPILVEDSIMSRAAVSVDDDVDASELTASEQSEPSALPADAATWTPPKQPEKSSDSEQLSVFRDFINSLDLDDFDRKRSN